MGRGHGDSFPVIPPARTQAIGVPPPARFDHQPSFMRPTPHFDFTCPFRYQMQMRHDEVIPILDFGSQFTQLIARRVREQGVYSELVRPDISIDELKKRNPKGIILSGGPSSVYDANAPRCDPRIFDLGVPALGICYGMQLAVHLLGGQIKPAKQREYGRAKLHITSSDPLVHGMPQDTTVW